MGFPFVIDQHASLVERRYQFRPGRRVVVDADLHARRSIEKRHLVHAGDRFQAYTGPFGGFDTDWDCKIENLGFHARSLELKKNRYFGKPCEVWPQPAEAEGSVAGMGLPQASARSPCTATPVRAPGTKARDYYAL